MFGKREHDPLSASHFRADRISLVNGQFFFSTRERTLEGPYGSREEAERESRVYIQRARRQAPLNSH
ncbi:DUF6316 family protein [Pseudomonas typographi]|uniref:DUF6316 domain-containing protein n=1 Tax=Pseudomonas typographi TaxID=2715964 RepID=A0ABR7Z026_9PSED|nr:DUF6316 family protein [Pseudomonas typographi]MBD1598825.1 hypothetical protein [Pseudomonas typographi]